jgi:hypothetical protein
VTPIQILKEQGLKKFSCSSWTRTEIDTYVAVMSEEDKTTAIEDFKVEMADKIEDRVYSMAEVVEIRYYFFGGSARYMFGADMAEALEDIRQHLYNISDAKQVFRGLTGDVRPLSVNHITSYFQGAEMECCLISDYVIEILSKRLGFAAILMFYRSSWVRGNPSVHGFVFECDLFTQIEQYKRLALSPDPDQEGKVDTTWTLTRKVRWTQHGRWMKISA